MVNLRNNTHIYLQGNILMSKYLNRLKARLAMQKLVESAKQGKNWIVTKKLVLEAEDADLELEPGDSVEVGANDNGDMVVGSKAAVVVITSPEVAEQVANAVVNADELSDVEFVTTPELLKIMEN